MLSSNRSQELTDGLTSPDSAVSTTSIVERMLRAYERSLEQQRLGFCIAIGIWVLVVLMGVIGLLWRSGGEERWDKWRGRPVEGRDEGYGEKEMDEKSGFKMLHLRNHSTVSGRQSPPPKSPVDHETVQHLANYSFPSSPPPTSPLPPVPTLNSSKEQPSSASWASLVDFFKPTLPPNEPTSLPSPKKRIDLPSLPSMSLTIPRAIRSKPTFKPRPLISRPRPSSQQRRASDMVDLRTGEYVERIVPSGRARSGVGKRVRGVGDDLMQRVRGRPWSQTEQSWKRRSKNDQAETGWEELDSSPAFDPSHPLDDSQQSSSLPYVADPSSPSTLPPTNPFADPSLLPPRLPFSQPPISPPLPHPYRSSQTYHPYSSENPFADSQSALISGTKQPSTYTPGSRPTNPFATPFDGADE